MKFPMWALFAPLLYLWVMLTLNWLVRRHFSYVICDHTYVLGFSIECCSTNAIFLVHLDGFPSCVLLEEELDEVRRFVACAEQIISTVLGRDLKFFDRLLTLRDHFLVPDVNLRVVDGMKLAIEEMLVKAKEIYADLSTRH